MPPSSLSPKVAATSLPSRSFPPRAAPGPAHPWAAGGRFPVLSSRPASRFPQEPAVPAGRSGNGPEIVTRRGQCPFDVTSPSSFRVEPAPRFFPRWVGMTSPPVRRGGCSLCPCKPQGSGWETWWQCQRIAFCIHKIVFRGCARKSSELALEVRRAALNPGFPPRDAVGPECPKFGNLLPLRTKQQWGGISLLGPMGCCV